MFSATSFWCVKDFQVQHKVKCVDLMRVKPLSVCLYVFLAVEDAVSTAPSTEHFQRLHLTDRSHAVHCSLLLTRLSQNSIGTPLTSEVTDTFIDDIVHIFHYCC